MRGLTKVVQSELEKTCQYSIQVWLDQVICGDDDHNVSDEVARGKWQPEIVFCYKTKNEPQT